MPEYRTSGGPMSHDERGDGPDDPLVLLHAFLLNCRMWAPHDESLSHDWRVISLDYIGFGSIHRPPD